jgi:hypothetical protein
VARGRPIDAPTHVYFEARNDGVGCVRGRELA